jgi:hypothetical protein
MLLVATSLLIVAELAVSPVAGLKLAAVSNAANVP